MSRSQESNVYNTATANSGADQTAATSAATAENKDIGNYEAQLQQYASENPFTAGGAYDTAATQKLSGVADAGSAALTDKLQSQAKRTGQNATAANLTAAEATRQNLRDLSGEEASTTADRLGKEAAYGQTVLGASEVPAQLHAGQYATALGAANGSLNTAQGAAQQPSFWDTLGTSFASQLGKTAGGGNLSLAKSL